MMVVKQNNVIGWLSLTALVGMAIIGATISGAVQAATERQKLTNHLEIAKPKLEAIAGMQVRLERIEATQDGLAAGQAQMSRKMDRTLEKLDGLTAQKGRRR